MEAEYRKEWDFFLMWIITCMSLLIDVLLSWGKKII